MEESYIQDDPQNPDTVKIVFAPHFLILNNDKFVVSIVQADNDDDHILFLKKKNLYKKGKNGFDVNIEAPKNKYETLKKMTFKYLDGVIMSGNQRTILVNHHEYADN